MSNNLPTLSGIKTPAMPTVDMFAATGILAIRRDWETGAIDWRINVYPKRHIPRDYCQKILAEIESANAPAPKPIAARFSKFLMGCYPSRELTDPSIFVSVITATFCSYPAEIGLQAIDNLTKQSKWLPTRADVVEACEALMLERRYAVEVVKAHIAEHDRLDRERDLARQVQP